MDGIIEDSSRTRRASDELSRATGGRSKRTWVTARECAQEVQRELDAGDESFAFKTILVALKHLDRLTDTADIAAWAAEPPRIADTRFDALLRILSREHLDRKGFHADWTHQAPTLERRWLPARGRRRKAAALASPVPELAKANIFIDRESLAKL